MQCQHGDVRTEAQWRRQMNDYRCLGCGSRFDGKENRRQCPHCGSFDNESFAATGCGSGIAVFIIAVVLVVAVFFCNISVMEAR